MQLRFPEIFCYAKQAIIDSLSTNSLILSKYNSTMAVLCQVTHFNIEEVENEENVGSVYLLLKYKERIITKYDKFETLNKTQRLRLLNVKGDTLWPYLMVTKVWDGVYPSCVAINEETGVVYLVYLNLSTLKLVEFSMLKENQLEAIMESLNDVTPYRIGLDENSMFKVLSEQEGTRYLHDNVFIEFDCGIKFRVYAEFGLDA